MSVVGHRATSAPQLLRERTFHRACLCHARPTKRHTGGAHPHTHRLACSGPCATHTYIQRGAHRARTGSRAVVLAQHIHTSSAWRSCVRSHTRTHRLTREASAEIWIFRHGKRPFGLAFIPPSRPGSGMQRMSNGQRSAPQRRSCDSLLGYASLPGVGMDAGFRSLSSRRSSREAARDWKRPC